MLAHGLGGEFGVLGLQGVHNGLVLFKGGLQVTQCAKGVHAVVAGAGANSEHFLAQIRVAGGLVNGFMKLQIARLPARGILALHECLRRLVDGAQGAQLLGRDALAAQLGGGTLELCQ